VVTKDDSATSVTAGNTIIYTIEVANNGSHDASNVTVSDTVPTGTTFVAASSTGGWSCTDGDPAGTVCTYDIASLATGGSQSLAFAVNVDDPLAASVTQIENTSSAADDGTYGDDPTPENNSATDTDSLSETAPSLTVTKVDELQTDADSSGNVSAGDTLRYTVTSPIPATRTPAASCSTTQHPITPPWWSAPSPPRSAQSREGTPPATAA
jgi:uncharacterized repeat protein (TIGR01451 family)